MGRTARTEPQCLWKGALYLPFTLSLVYITHPQSIQHHHAFLIAEHVLTILLENRAFIILSDQYGASLQAATTRVWAATESAEFHTFGEPTGSDKQYRLDDTNVPVRHSLTFMWLCFVTNFLIINQLDALISQIYFGMKLYMFRTVPLSISSSFSLYTQQWCMSHRFADIFRAVSRFSILILLANCQQTCMTYTIAVCTVKNSWWWTEELSETCRISFQKKFEKLVHLVGFIKKNKYLLLL